MDLEMVDRSAYTLQKPFFANDATNLIFEITSPQSFLEQMCDIQHRSLSPRLCHLARRYFMVCRLVVERTHLPNISVRITIKPCVRGSLM